MAKNTIAVAILADAAGVRKGTAEANKNIKGFSTSAVGMLKKVGVAYAAFKGFDLLKSSVGEAVGAVREQDRLMGQSQAVIKSTGGAANVTAGQIVKMSDAMERKSLIDAEQIQNGANVLLTFTKIRNEAGKGNDVFNQGTQAALDLSTALKMDMKSSATLVGKALNDPIKGVSALGKSGVQFSADQKKLITSLVESGDQMGAQKIILKELNTQFKGSAASAAKADGGIKRLKDMFDGFIEDGVRKALPVIYAFTAYMADNLPGALGKVSGAVQSMQPTFEAVGGVIRPIFEFLSGNLETVGTFVGVIGAVVGVTKAWAVAQGILNAVMAVNPLTLVVLAVAAVAAGLVYAYTHSERFRTIVQTAFKVVTTAAKALGTGVKAGIDAASTAVGIAAKAIKIYLTPATTAFKLVVTAVKGIPGAVSGAFGEVIGIVKGIPGKIKNAFGDVGGMLKGIGESIVQGLANGITGAADRLISWAIKQVTDKIPGKIKSFLGIKSPSRVTMKLGAYVTEGLVVGILSGGSKLDSAVKKLAGLTGKKFKEQSKKVFTALRAEARGHLSALVAQRNEYAASVTSGARDYAALSTINAGENGTLTAKTITQGLRDRLAGITNFTSKLKTLAKKGLSKDLYDQIVGMGVDQGSQYAEALAAGGPAAIKEANSLQTQINSASKSLGTSTSKTMYQAGIDTAKGYLNGLNKYIKQVAKGGDKIAKALVKSLKQALGIKSPSRVMGQMAEFTVQGLLNRLDASTTAVQRRGATLAGAITNGFGTPALDVGPARGRFGSVNYYTVTVTVQDHMSKAEQGKKFADAIKEAEKVGIV